MSMKSLLKKRREIGVSQRQIATLSGLSFRTIQLVESCKHDSKVSTLQCIAEALGYPKGVIEKSIESVFDQPVDSILIVSDKILLDGEESWKMWLFEFVDAFRNQRDLKYVSNPPVNGLSEKIYALITSVVETLCEELSLEKPNWCRAVLPLKKPWFVSGVENLKVMAILESPIHFRKRNIFVLSNFLSRR